MFKIVDYLTRVEMHPTDWVFTGEKNPWEVVMDIERIKHIISKDAFKAATPQLSKYLPLMPIENPAAFISQKESATPLIKSKRLGAQLGIDLYFKLEGKNPTGSFKDRGSAVDISVAKALGANAIILASTGNMAASCSCYAAIAQLLCFVIVPEDVPLSKLAQVISYGGKIIQVKGSYNDAARLAYESAKALGFYLAGDYAFRVEGQKTAAFELLDQLSLQVPDRVIVPIGCGTNLTAYAKGFDEYQYLGMTDRCPKLVGVQATGANAVVRGYCNKSNRVEKLTQTHTIASAISVLDPLDGVKALDAIYRTGGEAYDVTDQEILEAQYLLATEEGLFVESASATTLAYLIKKSTGNPILNETVVCILTGDGLKDPDVVLKSAIKPPTLSPNLEAFTHLYESQFFTSKTMLFSQNDNALLSEVPSEKHLNDLLFDLFGMHYQARYLKKIHKNIEAIIKKGKDLSPSDLQDVIQDALEQMDDLDRVFSIVDFSVTTAKDKRATATIQFKLNEVLYSGTGSGAGPVDAAVQALCSACNGLLNFELKNYKVDVRGQGADAIVYVEMKLLRNGFVSLGHSASPDIMQASLTAFENAYNGLPLQER